jgi:hypothetical protein
MKLTLKNSKILAESKTNDVDKLIIKGSYDHNLVQILKQVVYRIQKKFDLDSNLIIRKWLEEEGFQERFEEINKNIYKESFTTNSSLRDTLEMLLAVNNPDDFINKHFHSEYEKCGYVMDVFSNGFVKFCNCHKYLHKIKYNIAYHTDDTETDPDTHHNINNNKDNTGEIIRDKDVKHFFVKKTSAQVLDEMIFRIKFNIFLLYSRKVVDFMIKNFVEWINLNYEVNFITENDFDKMSTFLKRYPAHFRSKIAFLNKEGDTFCRIYLDKIGNTNGDKGAKIPKRLGFKLLDGIGTGVGD